MKRVPRSEIEEEFETVEDRNRKIDECETFFEQWKFLKEEEQLQIILATIVILCVFAFFFLK